MPDYSSNNKRIARNTFFLYLRMLFLLILSLYTSRILLEGLGIDDYGLYNVVGGIVTIFTFVSTAMSNSTLRFITFELGKNDRRTLNEVVTASRLIHFVLGILIIILAETIGLWYFNHYLVVQESRFEASFWVYQISIAACFLTIQIVPYNAMVIAHEKMSAYAIISAIESRTSSPIRITRDETFQSNIKGIYPCGEGAGYAGGITSAAADGIKVAEALISKYSSTKN